MSVQPLSGFMNIHAVSCSKVPVNNFLIS